MDPATLAGIAFALGMVLFSIVIEGSSPMSVVLVGPMVLVLGGTIGAGLASGTMKDVTRTMKGLSGWILYKFPDGDKTVDQIVSLADKARREGLLALEEAAKDVDDDFLREGLQSAIDGTDPDDLRDLLDAKIATKKAADKVSSKFFQSMGGYAPTVGIIGTVVSLVHVLENLSNPEELGHMIGAAFVATLWGLLTANMLWLPIAGRIARVSEIEVAHMEMTVEGLLAIQSGANPRMVGQRLRSLMPPGTAKEAA